MTSAEQQARDMLEQYGLADAQDMTAGDLVELANAIAHAKAWDIISRSPRFPEMQVYAKRHGIYWAAAVVELANAGLSHQTETGTTFFVEGHPRPQGSKDHVGGGRLVESSKGLAAWRWAVGLAANRVRKGGALHQGPLCVSVLFVLPRPKGVPESAGNAPAIKPPDIDKLIRGVLDALTGTLMVDDAQVTEVRARKRWACHQEPTGAEITVSEAI
jgi:crossover junction endodeoxyribonuclease RusA